MPVAYSNTTTKRLEGYARRQCGIDVGIAKTPDNSTGLWHVISENGEPLRSWYSLGWTVADAREALGFYGVMS